MKRLLASLLFLLPIFAFSVSSAKAENIDCNNPAHSAALGDNCAAIAPIINSLFDQTKANGPWYNQTPVQFSSKVFGGSPDEIFGERYTYAQINWIVNSLATMLNPAQNITNAGDLIKLLDALKKALAQNSQNRNPYLDASVFGPLAIFNNSIAYIYINPPASGISEVKNVASKFDLAQPAQAQGYGYTGLSTGGAVQSLWNASKNMAFFFMIILLIVSGFLIMFRVKINPQTVISIQTMIPKLIITLILVLFSFAIAGFLIDLVYILLGLVVALINSAGIANSQYSFTDVFNNLSDPYFYKYFLYQNTYTIVIGFVVAGIFLMIGLLMGGVGAAPMGVVGLIIAIAIIATTLITTFKIFMMLLKAYTSILLQISFAPLQIMMDLIPGQQGFGPWVRGLVSNLSVFVMVPLMLLLQQIFGGIVSTGNYVKNWGQMGGSGLQLPMTQLIPDIVAQNTVAQNNLIMRLFVGFTIFFMTPKVADMVRDFLKVPAFKYGAGLMDEAMAGLKVKSGIERHQKESEADALQRAKAQQEGVALAPGARGIVGGYQEARGAYAKAVAKDKSAETSAAYSASTANLPTDTRAFSGGASAGAGSPPIPTPSARGLKRS